MSTLTVECAAILFDGKVYSVPRPGRHHDVMEVMEKEGCPTPIRGEQGFLLSDGRFARRVAAGHVAMKAGQLAQLKWPKHGLFSEDLW